MKYDVIVIGSGIAGMSAAVMLAREGMRVLLLEQHTVLGGTSQCFKRKGEIFPTGVHYIGSLAPGQTLHRYMEYMGVMDRVKFVELDPEGFDEYRFPGMQFRMPRGRECFRDRLLEQFPTERAAIDRYLSDMAATCSRFALYNVRPEMRDTIHERDLLPLGPYLRGLTDSDALRAVLLAPSFLYSVPPAECPLFVHFLVVDSFLQSAWRVVGGSQKLVDAMAEILREQGGEIRKKAQVTAIHCSSGKVRGVSLKRGEVLESERVIFTGHIKSLFPLVPSDAFRPAFRERVMSTRETTSFFGVLLTQHGVQLEEPHRNIYAYPSLDIESMYRERLIDGDRANPMYCARTPADQPGDTQVHLLAFMGYDEVEEWYSTRLGWRTASYRQMKSDIADRLIDFGRRFIPEAMENAEVISTFTPLTLRDFLGAPQGSGYGIMKNIDQLRSGRVSSRTRISGLFLAGQNVVMPGVVGAVISSVVACGHILGPEYLMSRIQSGK